MRLQAVLSEQLLEPVADSVEQPEQQEHPEPEHQASSSGSLAP